VRRLAALLLLCAGAAHAQDIEPRAYSNAPVGVNFAIAGYVFTRGGLNFDGALPITDAELGTSNAIFAYARVLDLWGRTGKFDVIAPYTRLFGTAQFDGEPIERAVIRLQPSAFRLSVNLYGSPALQLREFAGWKQDLIVGASVQVSPPWGQYDDSRLVNIGGNRWTIKPELGVSKALGSWTLEMQAAATFFGDNDDFFGGHTRSQDPILSLQGHVIHSFPFRPVVIAGRDLVQRRAHPHRWRAGNDLQQNWRAGLIYALPLDRRNSLKFLRQPRPVGAHRQQLRRTGHRPGSTAGEAACEDSALEAPVHRGAVFDRARFDLDIEALAQQVLQRQHLAAADQRHAVADEEARREVLAGADTSPPSARLWLTPASSRPSFAPNCEASSEPPTERRSCARRPRAGSRRRWPGQWPPEREIGDRIRSRGCRQAPHRASGALAWPRTSTPAAVTSRPRAPRARRAQGRRSGCSTTAGARA
jgi:hypothetical protein